MCVIDERQRDHVIVHVAYPRLAAHAAFGRPHAQPLLRHLELEQLRRRVGVRLRLWCHGTPEAGTVAPRPGQAALSLRRTARRSLVRVARTYYTEPPSTCQHRPLPACLPLHAQSLHTMPSQAPDRRLPWPSGAARRADGRPRGRRAAGTHCRPSPSRPRTRDACPSRSSSMAPQCGTGVYRGAFPADNAGAARVGSAQPAPASRRPPRAARMPAARARPACVRRRNAPAAAATARPRQTAPRPHLPGHARLVRAVPSASVRALRCTVLLVCTLHVHPMPPGALPRLRDRARSSCSRRRCSRCARLPSLPPRT